MAKERERDKESKRIRKAFGDTLREYRDKKKWSQMKLALESGYHFTYISQLERGIKQPALSTIFILSRHLQIQPEEIVRAVRKKLSANS